MGEAVYQFTHDLIPYCRDKDEKETRFAVLGEVFGHGGQHTTIFYSDSSIKLDHTNKKAIFKKKEKERS